MLLKSLSISGIGAVGLALNEVEIQKLEKERNAYEASAREHNNLLNVVKNNIREINGRYKCTEDFIYIEESRISDERSILTEMKGYYPALTSVGVQIKTIQTFLTDFSSNVNVMNKKSQVLVALKPLLNHIDELVNLLEKNFPFLTMIGDKEIVRNLKRHL